MGRSVVLGIVFFAGVTMAASPRAVQSPVAPAPSEPASAASSTPSAYDKLVERLKAGDRDVNFTELRMAFTETPAYTGMMMAAYQSLWRTLNARDFAGALEVANSVLQRNYVEPNAHMVASIAHAQLGRQMESQYHRFIADGLLNSILSQGDGTSEVTAYRVIDISEEYAVFRARNLTPTAQSAGPVQEGAPIIDRMTVVDNGSKEQRVMYFAVENRESLAKKRATPTQ